MVEGYRRAPKMTSSVPTSAAIPNGLSAATSYSNELVNTTVLEKKGEHLETVFIEELELSVRAYNCLKRANVHTLSDLLQYSAEDLLEFKNFGQKSADEVCYNLKRRFDLDLKK